MEKIVFTLDDGTKEELYVIEKAKLSGNDYILVTDAEDGDSDAWIFKETKESGKDEAVYEEVTDDKELEALSSLFSSLLEDVDIVE